MCHGCKSSLFVCVVRRSVVVYLAGLSSGDSRNDQRSGEESSQRQWRIEETLCKRDFQGRIRRRPETRTIADYSNLVCGRQGDSGSGQKIQRSSSTARSPAEIGQQTVTGCSNGSDMETIHVSWSKFHRNAHSIWLFLFWIEHCRVSRIPYDRDVGSITQQSTGRGPRERSRCLSRVRESSGQSNDDS